MRLGRCAPISSLVKCDIRGPSSLKIRSFVTVTSSCDLPGSFGDLVHFRLVVASPPFFPARFFPRSRRRLRPVGVLSVVASQIPSRASSPWSDASADATAALASLTSWS